MEYSGFGILNIVDGNPSKGINMTPTMWEIKNMVYPGDLKIKNKIVNQMTTIK